MSRRLLAVFLILGSLALLPAASFAYTSDICKSSGDNYCVAKDVGPFMDGITKQCGNSGTCTLTDIMVVVTNVGNYATGIVGAIVLLMYTVGGFNYLLGGAMQDRVKKGKDMIKISTIGLFIVFFAYVGINTLRAVLTDGSIIAPGDATLCLWAQEGSACGENQVCFKGACTSSCVVDSANSAVQRSCQSAKPDDPRGCTSGGCPKGLLCCGPTPTSPIQMQQPSQ
jgi:Type IV secretion system pilin